MVKISVIVPSFNCSEYLDLCLRSIKETTDFTDIEIIVVLDGCTDNSKAVVNNYPFVKLYEIKTNMGLSNALNFGVLVANGDFVFLVNDDMVFPQRWAERLIPLFGKATVLCPQLIEPGVIKVADGLIEKDFGANNFDFNIKGFWKYEQEISKEEFVDARNHPLLLSRKLYMAIGGHDPNLTHADVDFYAKLACFLIKPIKTLSLAFYHFSGKSMKRNFDDSISNLQNKAYIIKKWRLQGHEEIQFPNCIG